MGQRFLVMDGEQVRILREEKVMSKRALADKAGLSEKTAGRVECEKPVRFSPGRKVADALGAEPSPSLGRVL